MTGLCVGRVAVGGKCCLKLLVIKLGKSKSGVDWAAIRTALLGEDKTMAAATAVLYN